MKRYGWIPVRHLPTKRPFPISQFPWWRYLFGGLSTQMVKLCKEDICVRNIPWQFTPIVSLCQILWVSCALENLKTIWKTLDRHVTNGQFCPYTYVQTAPSSEQWRIFYRYIYISPIPMCNWIQQQSDEQLHQWHYKIEY